MKTIRDITCLLLFLLPGTQMAAADFPLEWQPLSPQQGVLLLGQVPTTGLAATPPWRILRESKAISRYPLYGRLQVAKATPWLFRLDESRGSGSGYDRLIFDFNRNADLTDDVEYTGTVSYLPVSPYVETSLFGPLENAPEWKVGPWPAPLCVKVSLRKRSWWGRLHLPVLIGELQARPGWYLQTTVMTGNLREPLGLFDANCNLKLGETNSLLKFGPLNRLVSFLPRDLLLRDYDRNGAFDFTALYTDTQLFTPLLCLDTNVFSLELDPNLRFVRLKPFTGPVGEVRLHNRLQSAVLSWWRNGTWVPVAVRLEHGRATVPAGSYCLHSCVLRGVDTNGQQILARGYNYTTTNSFQVTERQMTSVLCGPPLELRVATRRYPVGLPGRGTSELCGLDINVGVIGKGGEVYSLYAHGPDLTRRSAPPTVQVLSKTGELLLTAQLEYG